MAKHKQPVRTGSMEVTSDPSHPLPSRGATWNTTVSLETSRPPAASTSTFWVQPTLPRILAGQKLSIFSRYKWRFLSIHRWLGDCRSCNKTATQRDQASNAPPSCVIPLKEKKNKELLVHNTAFPHPGWGRGFCRFTVQMRLLLLWLSS